MYSLSGPATPSSRKRSAPPSSSGKHRCIESPFVNLEMYDLPALFDVGVGAPILFKYADPHEQDFPRLVCKVATSVYGIVPCKTSFRLVTQSSTFKTDSLSLGSKLYKHWS
jgi:hypothetical protein